MAIDLLTVPIDLMTPGQYVEFDNSKAVGGLVTMPNRILVFAPCLSTGTGKANVPVQVTNSGDARTILGVGSIGAAMLETIFNVTTSVETWVVPISDPSAGAAATGKITVSGTPTEAGTIYLYVAGKQVQVGVTLEDTANTIAAAIEEAINAAGDLPVSAEAAEAVVTLTHKHKGTIGNDCDLRLNYYASEKTPLGISLNLDEMKNGTGAADISNAIAAVGDQKQYRTMVLPFSDDSLLASMEDYLDSLWGPLSQKEAVCWWGFRGTVGEVNTKLSTRNSQLMVCMTSEPTEPSPSYLKVAAAAITAAYYLNIAPACPLQTLQLPGLLPSPDGSRWIREERNLVLTYGGATTQVDDGGNVVIERTVTNYKKNSSGLTDPSYRDVETIYTLGYLRYTLRARIAQVYPRCGLVGDEAVIPAGNDSITQPKAIKAEIISLAQDWVNDGLIEDLDSFKEDLKVERDSKEVCRINARLPTNLVNQFRIFAGQIQFIL